MGDYEVHFYIGNKRTAQIVKAYNAKEAGDIIKSMYSGSKIQIIQVYRK